MSCRTCAFFTPATKDLQFSAMTRWCEIPLPPHLEKMLEKIDATDRTVTTDKAGWGCGLWRDRYQ